jgi:hypothetical protein
MLGDALVQFLIPQTPDGLCLRRRTAAGEKAKCLVLSQNHTQVEHFVDRGPFANLILHGKLRGP